MTTINRPSGPARVEAHAWRRAVAWPSPARRKPVASNPASEASPPQRPTTPRHRPWRAASPDTHGRQARDGSRLVTDASKQHVERLGQGDCGVTLVGQQDHAEQDVRQPASGKQRRLPAAEPFSSKRIRKV